MLTISNGRQQKKKVLEFYDFDLNEPSGLGNSPTDPIYENFFFFSKKFVTVLAFVRQGRTSLCLFNILFFLFETIRNPDVVSVVKLIKQTHKCVLPQTTR